MLNFFRINDPYRLIGLFIILVIVRLPLLIDPPPTTYPTLNATLTGIKVSEGLPMYSEILDSSAPFAAHLNSVFFSLFGRSQLAGELTGFIVLFFLSAFFGFMLINRKVFPENTFIPTAIFSVLALFCASSMTCSGYLFGFVFILLSMNNLFRGVEFREQRDENIFNTGFFIGFAALWDFSYWIYLPGCALILALFTRINLRKHLLLICGGLLPHLLLITYHFVMGTLSDLKEFYYWPSFFGQQKNFITLNGLFWFGLIPAFYFLYAIITLNRVARLTKYQSQLFQIMFIWTAITVVQIYLSKSINPQTLITLIPSLSFFITYLFILIRKRKFAELHFLILFSGIVTICYLVRYHRLQNVLKEDFYVSETLLPINNERVLVLTSDRSLYANNIPATGFINWPLAEKYFRSPQNPDAVAKIYSELKKDLPSVIYDPDHLTEPFFKRMPDVGKLYQENGDILKRVPPNN